jgi:hypothetical protein
MDDFVPTLEEVIFLTKSPLEIDWCGYGFFEGVHVTTVTHREIFLTINATIVWDLLVKNQDFWKPKNHITTIRAFYAPTYLSSL